MHDTMDILAGCNFILGQNLRSSFQRAVHNLGHYELIPFSKSGGKHLSVIFSELRDWTYELCPQRKILMFLKPEMMLAMVKCTRFVSCQALIMNALFQFSLKRSQFHATIPLFMRNNFDISLSCDNHKDLS